MPHFLVSVGKKKKKVKYDTLATFPVVMKHVKVQGLFHAISALISHKQSY